MSFRIKQAFLDCAFYLYPDERTAREGKRAGGSGFMAGRPAPELGEDQHLVFAVTNRHVVEGGNWTIRLNTKDGGYDVVDTVDTEWLYNQDGHDLAIRPLYHDKDRHRILHVSTDLFLTEEIVHKYDIGPGDECFVIGRFINHEGQQRNTPTVRFGQIAQSPDEPVKFKEGEQESFLVEIRSIGGYSGSPVFVYLDPMYIRQVDGVDSSTFPTSPWLLGVDWCMIPSWEKICDSEGRELPSGILAPANTGMMGVVPAWRLLSMLADDARVIAIADRVVRSILRQQKSLPPVSLTDGKVILPEVQS